MTKVAGNAPGYQREQDVFIQSNTSNLFQAFLQTYEKEDITLTSDIDIDDMIINVSASHGITAGKFLIIYNDDYYIQSEVKSVNVNEITLYSPSYLPFLSENTTIIKRSADLNIDGTTPVTFKFGIPSVNLNPIDINAALILLNHTADGGDNLYGGITALTNGFLVRKENSVPFNLGNYRDNRTYKLFNADVKPVDKPPAGIYGTEIKFKLQGQENFDQVIRISYGDFITGLVRDNLSTLLYKRVSLIGSYTEGE